MSEIRQCRSCGGFCGGGWDNKPCQQNVEVIKPTKIVFDIDKDSTPVVMIEHEGEDVLTQLPGGDYKVHGIPVEKAHLLDLFRRIKRELQKTKNH